MHRFTVPAEGFRRSRTINVALLALLVSLLSCQRTERIAPSRDGRQQSAPAGLSGGLSSPSSFVILASHGVALRPHAHVDGGDIGAARGGSAPFLVPGFSVAIDNHAFADPVRRVLGDPLLIGQGSTAGSLFTDHLDDKGGEHGPVSAFVAPPPLPQVSVVTPGSTAVTAPKKKTISLPAGAYGEVSVEQQATLRLTGGRYQISALHLKQAARVEAILPVELLVAGRLDANQGAYLGPSASSGLDAGAVRVEVSGLNGGNTCAQSGPVAVSFGENDEVRALVLAPGGTLELGEHSRAYGALFGRDVDIRDGAEVHFQAGFAGCPSSCDDGNPCTDDACSAGACTHTPVAAGTSCSDGNACNGLETCNGAGQCSTGAPPVVDDGNPCTADACSPQAGVSHTPLPAGTACSDGNACHGASCDGAGTCVAGTPLPLDDGNPCTVDSCDPLGGVQHQPAAAGTSCSDGNACNGAETCDGSGSCLPGAPPAVDDHNPCTADACDPATGVTHAPLAAGTSCSDSDACNGAEACDGMGHCLAGTPPVADDGNPCTADGCDASSGVWHVPQVSGTSCSDGNACNGAETCDGLGACQPAAPPAVDDGNPCTIDACDPATGVSHAAAAAGTPCLDGNVCNGAEACDGAGHCAAGVPLSLDDGNPCTLDTCDAAAGVAHAPAPSGTPCSDGNACNGLETCGADASCQPGQPLSVEDFNPCTADSCNPASGEISHTPLPQGASCGDGNVCNGAEVCDGAGHCQEGTPLAPGTACSDGNPCNGEEQCVLGGACTGTAPSFDDGDPCTVDSCDPATGAVSHAPAPAGTPCPDGNECNGAETCDAQGLCQPGTPLTAGTSCSDGNVCNGVEACDGAGLCVAGEVPVLDLSNPCVFAHCDPLLGPQYEPRPAGWSCADGNACNGEELCDGQSHCQPGTPLAQGSSCSDGDPCNGVEACSAQATCVAAPPAIDDGNPCTVDSCDSLLGIVHAPVLSGTPCPDGNACNGDESCDGAGHCSPGAPPAADDGNPCTDDACDPVTGVSHAFSPQGAPCSDGNVCNGSEACDGAGHCASGSAPALDDGNPCTADACDAATGVTHAPLAAGTSCSDGNACNGAETCDGAGSCLPGAPPAVDDGNPCTVDLCSPEAGVTHAAALAGAPCGDGNACNGLEVCDGGGHCQAGTAPPVDDGNACTADSCDPALGVLHAAVADGTSCSDGNACTQGDICQAGACVAGAPVACAAADACHGAGTCDPATGACSSPLQPAGTSCDDGDPCTHGDSCGATGSCAGTKISCTSDPCTVRTCNGTASCSVSQVPAGTSCSNAGCVYGAACDGAGACGCSLPAEPSAVAPPLDRTVVTTLCDATRFLYSGPQPIQSGVAQGVIDCLRVAVVRGHVYSAVDNAPLPGVQITVVSHPELGQTLSRQGGGYDLAVNGGGSLSIDYKLEGYVPVRRTMSVPVQDYVALDDVFLTPFDSKVSSVDTSGSSLDCQLARGSTASDARGSRTATLIFPAGVSASLRLADGTSVPQAQLHMRATEVTVGPNGPKAMPAELPPTTAYTYAVELSADEAVAANASSVLFSSPVASYTEDFIGFPVGTVVPAGFFDRGSGCCGGSCWVPSANGRVVKVVSVTAGVADLDTDGDGQPDSEQALSALGISLCERQQLGALYAAGQSLWRVPVPHMTLWDYNYPWGPPAGAEGPTNLHLTRSYGQSPLTGQASGNFIGCEGQDIGKAVDVAGTDLQLEYVSSRAPGADAYTLHIPLSGPTLPAVPPERITLTIDIAGRTFKQLFPAEPDLSTDFRWDGKDAYGRVLQGRQPVTVRVGYDYKAVYQPSSAAFAQSFAAVSNFDVDGFFQHEVQFQSWVNLSTTWKGWLGTFDAVALGLGGLTIDAHHVLDPVSQTLWLGDGRRRSAELLSPIVRNVAGSPEPNVNVDGVPATKSIVYPAGFDVAPDGTIYFAEPQTARVRKIDPQGIITTFAGMLNQGGFSGDGGPATSARLLSPQDVAVAPDGSVYIADYQRIRRVDPSGVITTFAGNGLGACDFGGNEGPALSADLCDLRAIAVSRTSCEVYVAHSSHVRRIDPNGVIHRFAGSSSYAPWDPTGGDGGPAWNATFVSLFNIAVAPNGEVFTVENSRHRVRKVGVDGIIRPVAGKITFAQQFSGDFGPATEAGLVEPTDIAIARDGSVYIADTGRVRQVTPDGLIRTVAGTGNGSAPSFADGIPALQASVGPVFLALGPDESLFFAEPSSANRHIYRLSPVVPGLGTGDVLMAGEDGRELYVFDASGRHLRTLDTLTGGIRRQFGYDAQGRLVTLTDGAGNVTAIQRDGAGVATAIVSPSGQITGIGVDANGYLSHLTDPTGALRSFVFGPTGLLTSTTAADGRTESLAYDASGRLSSVTDEAGSLRTLGRSESLSASTATTTVTNTSQLGRSGSVELDENPGGDLARTSLAADGTQRTEVREKSGTTTVTLPSGAVSVETAVPDPRFGQQAPYQGRLQMKMPSGLSLSATHTRTVTLADPNNALLLATQTDAVSINGQPFTTTYTQSTRTAVGSSPLGRTATLSLDESSRLSSFAPGGLAPISLAYDTQGRVASVGQGGRTYARSHDASGNLASVTNPAGEVLGFPGYDSPGRPSLLALPDGSTLSLGYDQAGNVTSLLPSGKPAHAMAYTALGTLLGYAPPSAGGLGVVQYTYNADHQLTQVKRLDGSTIAVAYAPNGRPVSIALPRGTTTLGYAPSGQLSTLTAPDGGTLSYAYDGELLLASTWSGEVSGTVVRSYDSAFRVSSETVSGGDAVSFSYDADGLRTGAGPMTLSYDPSSGLLTGTSLGQATDLTSYDAFGAVASYQASSGSTPLFSSSLVRNALGQVSEAIEVVEGESHAYAYGYDALGRLLSVTRDGAPFVSYAYGPNGNRSSSLDSHGSASFTYDDQDRLVSAGSATYAYTLDGELLSKTGASGTTSYVYDAFGSLVSATLPDGTTLSYVLDGKGRRIGKKVNGVLVQGFLYGGPGQIVAELDGSGSVVRRFVYATDRGTPDLVLQGGSVLRLISDPAGSPRLLVDASTGAVVQRMEYDPFGNVLSDTHPGAQPFGFAGGLLDRDLGLVRFGARDYDPATGRFTTKDPLGFRGGSANLYAYAFSDPVNLAEPSALEVGGAERVGGLPFGVGRLLSQAYAAHETWRTEGILVPSRVRSGGGLDVALVNPTGEPVGLTPHAVLPNGSETCSSRELLQGQARNVWQGFHGCPACSYLDDLLAQCMPAIPAAAGTATRRNCSGSRSGSSATGTAPPPSITGPSVAQLATASSGTVTTASVDLGVLGADPGGEAGLIYTWSTSGTPPAPVAFSANGTNASKNTTASFTAAGAYTFVATLQNGSGQTVSSSVHVLVKASPAQIVVSPAIASVGLVGSQAFAAAVSDQFGQAISPPPALTWLVSGGGSIDANGLFTAAGVPGGPHEVLAFVGDVSGQAHVSIGNQPPVIVVAAAASPTLIDDRTTTLSVLGGDDGGEGNLTYHWTASGPGNVGYQKNSNNAAKLTEASVDAPGSYQLTVAVRDAYGLLTTSSVSLEAVSTPAAVQVFPFSATVGLGKTLAFSAKGHDQFGLPLSPQVIGWSVSGGGTIDPSGMFHAGNTVGGPFVVTATAGTHTAQAAVFVTNGAPGLAEGPSAQPNPTFATTSELSVLGDDIDGENTLSYTWSSEPGQPSVSFSANGTNAAKQSTVTFTKTGFYNLRVTVDDGTNQPAQALVGVQVNVSVVAVGITPPSATAEVGEPLSLAAKVTDQFGGHGTEGVSFAWSAVSGPATPTFASPAGQVTDVTFPALGTYVVRLSASSNGQTRTADASVTVTPVNHAPVVTMGPGASLKMPQSTATVSGSATDDGLPAGSTLTYQWSVAAGPSTALFASPQQQSTQVTFVDPGVYHLKLTASDGKLSSSGVVQVSVDAADGPVPSVALTGPEEGAEITHPVDITGSVTGGSWKLEYRLGGEGDDGWVTFAHGAGPKSGTLGKFDPTLLLNGSYAVRLTATTAEGTQTADLSAAVTRNMKVGYFTLAFTDLEVPVSGLPITLVRRYDSRDKRSGDFGVGWTLDIKNVRVEQSRTMGKAWDYTSDNSLFPTYCLESAKSHEVTVTFGGNKVYRFRAAPTPHCSFILPITNGDMAFEPVAPTLGKLEPLDSNGFMVVQGKPGKLLGIETVDTLDLNRYVLTTEDGTRWVLSRENGVESMSDRVGNTLTIDELGIHHSSGLGVTFVRDAKGRITSITDPNGKVMTYAYDAEGNLSTYTDRMQAQQSFSYQSDHLLLEYTDANGHKAVRTEYDTDGRLLSQTDAKGKKVLFAHDVAARTEQVTDRRGNITTYEYDLRGNVTRITDALGGAKSMTYDDRDNKLSETDQLGHTTTYTYDANDNVATTTDPLGHTTTQVWNGFRQLVSTTDPLGHTRTNTYDVIGGNLQAETDALGHTTLHGYGPLGLRILTEDALGHQTHFDYDGRGRMTKVTDALGHQTLYSYDDNGNKLSETTTRTHQGVLETLVTSYEYDASGRLVRTVYPDGSSTGTVYSRTGKQLARVNELGRITAFSYDELERLVVTAYPDGTTTNSTYDAEGRVDSRTTQAARTTSYSYDALGRIMVTTHADGSTSSQAYDAAGRVVVSTNENGHPAFTGYDDAGRRTSITDALGHTIVYGYDAADNLTDVADALGHTTHTSFDANSRPTQTTFADGSFQQQSYDSVGRRVSETDELGHVTSRGYDAVGRVTSVTDALGNTTSYAYDELGELVEQIDANAHTTRFVYDKRRRPTRRILPDGTFESRSYDASGAPLTRTDFLSRTTEYSYDEMNRLTRRLYPDGSSVTFAYTPTGRRQSATDARGVTSYGYDLRDRMASVTCPDGRRLAYSYDGVGHRTSTTAQIGSASLTTYSAFDAVERPSFVTDPLGRMFAASYDATSRITALGYPNGTLTTYGYDTRGRLASIATLGPGATTVQNYALTLDAAGRRTHIIEADGTSRTFGYDSLSHLSSEEVAGGTGPAYAKTFVYDAVGNRQSQATTGHGAGFVAYAYDSRDRLLAENATSYASDANGNVMSRTAGATYFWDFDNRLTSVILADGMVVQHQYDVDGYRVRTTVTPSMGIPMSTDLLVDSTGSLSHVVAESVDGAATAFYVRLGDELLASLRPAGGGEWATRFVHHDAVDSVRVLTNEAGVSTDFRSYEAFGANNVRVGSDPLAYGFAGEPFDGASGLAYHRARWMDPSTGRFDSADPLGGEVESFTDMSGNRYAYAANNPVSRADPTGWEDVGAIVGVYASLGRFSLTAAPRVDVGKVGKWRGKGRGPYVSQWTAVREACAAVQDASWNGGSHMPGQSAEGFPLEGHAEWGSIVVGVDTRPSPTYYFNLTTSGSNTGVMQDQSIAKEPGVFVLARIHNHPRSWPKNVLGLKYPLPDNNSPSQEDRDALFLSAKANEGKDAFSVVGFLVRSNGTVLEFDQDPALDMEVGLWAAPH